METPQDVVAKEEEFVATRTGGPEYLNIFSVSEGSAQVYSFVDNRGGAFPGCFVNITGARLRDESGTGNDIFAGTIFIEIQGEELRPAHLAVITRMLDPYPGTFNLRVLGTYTINNPTLATVKTNFVVSAGIGKPPGT